MLELPEDPLAFFEELLQRGGLQKLHEGFKPSKEELKYFDFGYDEYLMCKISEERDQVTEELHAYKLYFKDELEAITKDEIFKARKIFIKELDKCFPSLKESVVDNFIIRLEYFINKAEGRPEDESNLIAKLPIIRQYLISLLKDIKSTYKNRFNSVGQNLSLIQNIGEKGLVVIHPFFNKNSLPTFLEFIQDFFAVDNQSRLKDLFETGKRPQKPICFNGNGSRLADAFKQMITFDLITQCNKKELAEWIRMNFVYKQGGYEKQYNIRTLDKIISSKDKDTKCQKPLFKIIIDAQGNKILTHILYKCK